MRGEKKGGGISELHQKAHKKGLDVDGSREMLIASLAGSPSGSYFGDVDGSRETPIAPLKQSPSKCRTHTEPEKVLHGLHSDIM